MLVQEKILMSIDRSRQYLSININNFEWKQSGVEIINFKKKISKNFFKFFS